MKKKVKVLHIINWLNYGGAENFLLNLLENLNDNIHNVIIVRNENNPMAKKFLELGVEVIIAPSFPKNIIRNYNFMKNYILNHGSEFSTVHIYANSLIYTFPIKLFKKYAPNTKVLLHSHSSQSTKKIVTRIHNFNRKKYNDLIDFKVACSYLAGKWMFADNQFQTIYNGIDVDKFKFRENSRNNIRKSIGANGETIIIGLVGRLTPVKNHIFAIKILETLISKNSNYRLLVVGTGELEKKLKKEVKEKGLDNFVIFTGSKNNVNEYLCAMDIYIQPSLFEGFPFSVIEAEISNLPVLMSDKITTEVIISDIVSVLPLENISAWSNKIMHTNLNKNRTDLSKVRINKVDISSIAKEFEKLYLDI